jgi:hypothetical protein
MRQMYQLRLQFSIHQSTIREYIPKIGLESYMINKKPRYNLPLYQ